MEQTVTMSRKLYDQAFEQMAKTQRQLEMAITIMRERPATFRAHSPQTIAMAREHIVQALGHCVAAQVPWELDDEKAEALSQTLLLRQPQLEE